MARLDPHSYADDAQPQVKHLDWKARVDFAAKTLDAEATLTFEAPGDGDLELDTRDLEIHEVRSDKGEKLPHQVFAAEPILGSRLLIDLPRRTTRITLRYRTSPTASALQWLTPAQTAGGQHPFLFSQCQAIHARSVVPLQDTPRVRIRYTAELTIPAELKAVMAAGSIGREQKVRHTHAIERFEMPQPIPPYLLALAVGDLQSQDLGPRSRVWAEPKVLDKAAWEFAQVEKMIQAAEKLFGPYEWERFDILTMPPSFPYGGMENPRLTFLTPTLLAGDRSLVNVLAHELAHSWTGNLVTNSNAEHFWLNEGFTVFAERKILEALEGPEKAALHAALGRRSLDEAVALFRQHPELTRLRTSLKGIDPDEAFSQVPYEKGYLFLRALEDAAGADRFAKFVHTYVATFRFKSITTEEFTALVERELPGVLEKVNANAWLNEPGVPGNAPAPKSARLQALSTVGPKIPDEATTGAWSATEWELFIEGLPHPAPEALCREVDQKLGLTGRKNYEILVSWLTLAAQSGYREVFPRIEEVLGSVGRMKYLKPLYRALAKNPASRDFARECFDKSKDSYHPIARQVVENLLKAEGA